MEGSREGGHKVTDCLASDASALSFFPFFFSSWLYVSNARNGFKTL